jgi:hypothetical protein
MAANATRDLLWLAQQGHGGEAGDKLLMNLIAGPDSSFGDLEIRLAIGALATAQKAILERLEELED